MINKYDFRNEEKYSFKSRRGLSTEIVKMISDMKNEPQWMRDFRLKSWKSSTASRCRSGAATSASTSTTSFTTSSRLRQGRSWDDVPDDIKRTFDKLGIPEAEKKFLSA